MDPSALPRTLKRFEFALKVILIICGLVFAVRFAKKCEDEFTLAGIRSASPYGQVNNPPLPDLFGQRFTYLGSGGQCFVFFSEDGSYVLKFFKYRSAAFWQKKKKVKLQEKLDRDFTSYKLAMEQLPEETGLLYVHLNKTDTLKTRARIVDKLGVEYRLELDQAGFILQKRAELIYPHLLELVHNGDMAGAKEAIDSIYSVITRRCQKGIHDEDAKIHRNCGFIGNQAVIIDVGSFKADLRRQDPKVQKRDLALCTERLKLYLEEISPELAIYIESKNEN